MHVTFVRTTWVAGSPRSVVLAMPHRLEPLRGDITVLLTAMQARDPGAARSLFELVYQDLRTQAHALFARQGRNQTLQATVLVHEAWLKLGGGDKVACAHRGHFFALAAKAMRQVLTDYARARLAEKRGGAQRPVTVDEGALVATAAGDVLALEDCLSQLGALNARHAQVVELRVFGGLTIEATAEALGVSHGTVESDWKMARAWLRRKLIA